MPIVLYMNRQGTKRRSQNAAREGDIERAVAWSDQAAACYGSPKDAGRRFACVIRYNAQTQFVTAETLRPRHVQHAPIVVLDQLH